MEEKETQNNNNFLLNNEMFQLFSYYWLDDRSFKTFSQVFCRKKNMIQLCSNIFSRLNKKQLFSPEKSTLLSQYFNLQQLIKSKKEKLEEKMRNYHQIIQTLFKIKTYSRLDKVRSQLYNACCQEDAKLVFLLTLKQVNENGISFVLNEDEKQSYLLRNYSQNNDVFIPQFIKYKGNEYYVTKIYEYSFKNSKIIKSVQFPIDTKINFIEKESFLNSSIETITIPSYIIDIYESTFSNCKNLKQIVFQENSNLISIKEKAFYNSSIESLIIPSSVKHVEESSFSYCYNLKNVEFCQTSELKTIGKFAFAFSSLEKLSIPSSVEKFEEGWCCGTSRLNNIVITQNNIKNILYYHNDFIIGKSDIKSDLFDVLIFARRNIERVIIPSFIKHIAPYSFYECKKLKMVEFDCNSQLLSIKTSAFSFSSIEMITIPSTVTNICEYSFSDCHKLKYVEISEKSESMSIGKCAFSHSHIQNIKISSSSLIFEKGWCQGISKLNEIQIIPNEVSNIQSYEDKFIIGKSDSKSNIFDTFLFACRDVDTVVIPSFINLIASYSFNKCKHLKKVIFSDQIELKSIDENAFSETSIEEIFIPNTVTQIGNCAFYGCKHLKNVFFQNISKLESIGKEAFSYSSIKNILIPSNVKYVGDGIFSHCHKLKKVDFLSDSKLESFSKHMFLDSSLETIYIPSQVINLKRGWCYNTKKLTNIIISPKTRYFSCIDNSFIIGKSDVGSDTYDLLYFARRNIQNIKLPSFIRKIMPYACNECIHLNKIEFPDDCELISIGKHAFSFSSIRSITIPLNVLQINEYAFYHCQKMRICNFAQRSQLRSIGKSAFAFSSIECFFIPRKVTKIGEHACYSCQDLQIIELEENSKLYSIDFAFFKCVTHTNIMLPCKTYKNEFFII